MFDTEPSWQDPLRGRSLSIDYPCPWDYQIIGEDEDSIRAVVGPIVEPLEFMLTLANRSKKGRYVSMHLTLTVRDEAHRIGIFEALKSDARIKYVL